VTSQIGTILPAVETPVHVDGARVILPEGDLLVASGRHILCRNWRRPTPAHQTQRILSDGTSRPPPGRHLKVRAVVTILGLTARVAPPASNAALVGGDAADVVVESGADLAELDALGWAGLSLVVFAPANGRAVPTQPARVGLAGRHLNEGTGPRSVGLTVMVGPPAQDVAPGGLDAADVVPAAADLNEGLVFRRRGDPPPARDGTGGSHGTAVGSTGGYLLEDAGRGIGLAVGIVAEAADGTAPGDAAARGQGAGEVMPRADGGFVVRTSRRAAVVYREAPANRFVDKPPPVRFGRCSCSGVT